MPQLFLECNAFLSSTISIVGGGPAGLFCAYLLLEKGYRVNLYDQKTSLGRKFLIAGNGGLNLTHSENLDLFSQKYGKHQDFFYTLLKDFSPKDLQDWCDSIGVETFVGSSGRVFPKKFKAANLLKKWIDKLKASNRFTFFKEHFFVKIDNQKKMTFKVGKDFSEVTSDKIIFALGGGSWKKTGSDGTWVNSFKEINLSVEKLRPMNCGFNVLWSKHFLKKIERAHLKNIRFKFEGKSIKGEMMLTPYGIEGGCVYALSKEINDALSISKESQTLASLDLKPDLSESDLLEKLKSRNYKNSLKNILRKNLNIDEMSYQLLLELSDIKRLQNVDYLINQIKNLRIKISSARDIDEAISTSGGVRFEELSDSLECNSLEGLYFAGEMLDFEAITGGYLLQGCFSTASRVCSNF